MNARPDISIVLPTYNRAPYLPDCIASVLCQTHPCWELIVVEDGSKDDSLQFLTEISQVEPRIRLVNHGINRGLPLALNSGVFVSKGSYVTFLNSDDLYYPEHLALRYAFMREHPDVDLLHGGVEIIGDPFVTCKFDSTKRIHLDTCPVGGTFFGKRSVFVSLGGFRNVPYSEDSDFMERAEMCFRVKRIEQRTYRYNRTTPDSITNRLLEGKF